MKPILFNTEMVQSILDGRKTVTRRVVKPQPSGAHSVIDSDDEERSFDLLCGNGGEGGVFLDWAETIKAPCWPGDILWVRETFQVNYLSNIIGSGRVRYKADEAYQDFSFAPERYEIMRRAQRKPGWRPNENMPREAARIFLRVTDVRVERLQDISYAETFDEGLSDYNAGILSFSRLWNKTVKPADRPTYGWEANPLVWVIQFERISKEEAIEKDS